MIPDYIIDAIVLIGNNTKVIKLCEPQVMQSMELKHWMVVRTLKALELLEDEWEIYQTAGVGLPKTPVPD